MRKVVISGIIGNGLEWYDYALYGHFAALISTLFFPSTDKYASLIATYGVFALGFVMRPAGAVLFGYIGDRMGRRTSLSLSILLMAIPTGCIGMLPTFEQIGIWAPILLAIIRMLQGLSLGGEFSGSMVFMVEHLPQRHRGLAGSISFFSMCVGILVGSATGTLVSELMTKEDFESWGWRVPFLIGILIGLVGLYIRTHVSESPKYQHAKKEGHLSKKPISEAFKKHWRAMLTGIGIYLTVTVPFYALLFFMNGLLTKMLGHPASFALMLNSMSTIILIILIPISAYISDRIGRKPVLITAAMGIIIFSYPCFWLLTQPGELMPAIGQLVFAVLTGIFLGPVPTVLVELFPTRIRYTGMAMSYNFSAAAFGGTMPMVSTWLIQQTGSYTIVGIYIMVCAVISLITLCFYKDRYNKPLEE